MSAERWAGCFVDPKETRAAGLYFASANADSVHPALEGFRDGETVMLPDAELEAFGRHIRQPSQLEGTCVGVNCGQALNDSIVNVCVYGDQAMEQPPSGMAWEANWANARTANDIGRGQLTGDGCCVPWMATAMYRGVFYRGNIAGFDLTKQDEDFAETYGKRGNRVPQQVLSAASPGIKAAFNAQTQAQVLGALRARFGGVRAGPWKLNAHCDSNGYSGWLPCGGHCESWRGVVQMPSGPMVAEQQLWTGDCPQGEITITDAHGDKVVLPDGCRLIGMQEVAMALKEGDVWFFAAPFDLPARAA